MPPPPDFNFPPLHNAGNGTSWPPDFPPPGLPNGGNATSQWNHNPLNSIFPDILWTAVAISTSFAVLYGLFLALAVVSVYLLLRRGVRRRPLTAIQLFAVTALLVSTTTHWAVVVLQRFGGLLSHPATVTVLSNKEAFLPEECVGTATLTVNLILSDIVVWWRVWVLWKDSRVLYGRIVPVCAGVLLLATFVTGTVDTNFACHDKGGFMYEGSPVGTAVLVLSLVTNLAATTLTAYKAWVHRRCIRSHVASGSRSTQVESIFALLVESGALYCTLWIVVVVWQIGSRIHDPHMHSSIFFSRPFSAVHQPHPGAGPRPGSPHSFWFRGGVLVEGCLVPLIATYPTAIIVLVALNKSAVENGLRRDARGGAGPGTAIAVAVETVVESDTHTHAETDSDAEDDTACASSEKAEGVRVLASLDHCARI